jgi:3,4-dihydroxy-2-butanone 4-phosphate synthase
VISEIRTHKPDFCALGFLCELLFVTELSKRRSEMSVLIGTEEAVAEIKKGRIVILVDDQDHQITGNLTTAAEKATHEAINFMKRHGKGSVYLSAPPEKFPSHEPALTIADIKSGNGSSVTVSHGGANGSAGFAAPGPAATILKAADLNTGPRNLISSDYFRPLLASSGGVLVRAGQAEGSMDLARLAGLPCGVIEVRTLNGQYVPFAELVSIAENMASKSAQSETSSSIACERKGWFVRAHTPFFPPNSAAISGSLFTKTKWTTTAMWHW